MAANTNPIFPDTPNNGPMNVVFTAANTAKDGTGTTQALFTAGVDGGFVDRIIALPIGTNVASVLRIFENNGGSSAVAANNSLIAEASLPASALSEVAAQTPVVINLKRPIPAAYVLRAAIGTAVAAGWAVKAVGGDY